MSLHPTSGNGRVADVLKSSLERQLIDEEDAVLIAGHGSHVVTDIFEPGAPAPLEGMIVAGWDESKHREFAERLSRLKDDNIL